MGTAKKRWRSRERSQRASPRRSERSEQRSKYGGHERREGGGVDRAPEHQGQAGRQRDRVQDQEDHSAEEADERLLREADDILRVRRLPLRRQQDPGGANAGRPRHGGQRRDRRDDAPGRWLLSLSRLCPNTWGVSCYNKQKH